MNVLLGIEDDSRVQMVLKLTKGELWENETTKLTHEQAGKSSFAGSHGYSQAGSETDRLSASKKKLRNT